MAQGIAGPAPETVSLTAAYRRKGIVSVMADLPHLTKVEQRILELVNAEPACHARHSFRSAINHLGLAHPLVEVDAAMALFRGITAEEEAASGLMRVLKDRCYPRSGELRPHDHVQKHAVVPFLEAVVAHGAALRFTGIQSIRIAFKEVQGRARIVTVLTPVRPSDYAAFPMPPFNFTVRGGVDYAAPDFRAEIGRAMECFGYTNFRSFVEREANVRNMILYAAPDGYPLVERVDASFLQRQQRRIFLILKAALMIWPYDEHQPFVEEALAAFLNLVLRLRKDREHEGRDNNAPNAETTPRH
jgi:hypothetical protein